MVRRRSIAWRRCHRRANAATETREETMPLTIDARQCPDTEFVMKTDWTVTESFMFSMMDVGIRAITEESGEEFLRRTAVMAKLRGGTMLQKAVDGEIVDRPYTAEDVAARVGFTTNVSPMTKREFTAKVKRLEREYANR
jgi:hypothetical protein